MIPILYVLDMNVVKLGERDYPKLLAKISDAPKQLFFKGEWDTKLFEKCLAVVGSRRMTGYGERATRSLVYDSAAAGITIVSGFMYGVDAAAHTAAVEAGGKTIAVMPCGIDLITPEYQHELYKEIINTGGLIISEFEADYPPDAWTFPKRNRIIAALSQATLVVEAGLNSGSLITAGLAKDYDRQVFAVPGNIDSKVSQGTFLLIENGAEIVTSPDKILEFFGVSRADVVKSAGDTLHSGELLDLLVLEPLNLDELTQKTGEEVSKLTSQLTFLEMQGLVTVTAEGKYYVG